MKDSKLQADAGFVWYKVFVEAVVLRDNINRQVMKVWRKIEACSRNHCCGKAIFITYSECVCVCVCNFSHPAWKASASHDIFICGLSGSIIFFENGTIFEKTTVEHKMYVSSFVCNISNYKKNSVRHYRKCTNVYMLCNRYSCQILIQFGNSWQICENYSNNKFHENSSRGSQVVTYAKKGRQTDRYDEPF